MRWGDGGCAEVLDKTDGRAKILNAERSREFDAVHANKTADQHSAASLPELWAPSLGARQFTQSLLLPSVPQHFPSPPL